MKKFLSLGFAALIFSVALGTSLLIDFFFFNERPFNKLLTSFSIILFLVGISYIFLGKRINEG